MNDEDLRDLFAAFAMMGLLASARGIPVEVCTQGAYKFADAMIEAKYAEPEVGIAAVKKRNKLDATINSL